MTNEPADRHSRPSGGGNDASESPFASDLVDLRNELAACNEEIARLRNLLIAKDTELGTALGRLAEQEYRTARILNSARRLYAIVPRLRGWARRKLHGHDSTRD